ncbi:MAG: sulfatase/phosphatase domain-containing protein, partial [Opitutae bacterium]
YGIDEWELYDLKADPTERTSRYGDPKYAEITAKLKKELTRLQKELKVPEDTRPIQRRKPAPKNKKS